MRAQELRIGNYVNVPRADQSPFRIDAFEYLSEKFIKVAMIHPEYGEDFHPLTWYGNDLTPIPLTEELLLKCGFEKSSTHFVYNIDKYKCIILMPDNNRGFYLCDTDVDIDFHYLHTLQNFFALTNQELKINL